MKRSVTVLEEQLMHAPDSETATTPLSGSKLSKCTSPPSARTLGATMSSITCWMCASTSATERDPGFNAGSALQLLGD
eukprot:scaffold712_cov155-Isochrysis_galbana.AAC.2